MLFSQGCEVGTSTSSRASSLALTEATNASVYYTPLSVGDQIDESFRHYRRPYHADIIGCRNLYPYHGPLSDVEEEKP